MGADFDVVCFAVPDRLHHDQRVAAVEATRYIRNVDRGEQLEVWTAYPIAVLYKPVGNVKSFPRSVSSLIIGRSRIQLPPDHS